MNPARSRSGKSPVSMAGKNCSSGSTSAFSKWRWMAGPMASGPITASRISFIISAALSVRSSAVKIMSLPPSNAANCNRKASKYYHRYLSLFQIDEFEGVIRDTQRNLDLFTFVDEHSEREDLVWSFQQFRPYVLMMNTRARVSILLADGQFGDAISEIEKGRDRISEFFQQSAFPELEAKSSEIAFLDEWLEEVRAKRPLSKLEVMEREMERAIQGERYERAAELRDAIRLIKTRPEVES